MVSLHRSVWCGFNVQEFAYWNSSHAWIGVKLIQFIVLTKQANCGWTENKRVLVCFSGVNPGTFHTQ